jgi:hypothetical protein
MERLDQGHLHPKLEIPGLTVGGEHSKNEPFEQLVNSYLEHLHMSPSACVTWTYMNTHDLH